MQELLSQLSHYSERVRKDALTGLQQLLLSSPEELGKQVSMNWRSMQHDCKQTALHACHATHKSRITCQQCVICVQSIVNATVHA